jgi:hypothetical protein
MCRKGELRRVFGVGAVGDLRDEVGGVRLVVDCGFQRPRVLSGR